MMVFPSGLLGRPRWDASHLPWAYSYHQDQVLRCPEHHQGACFRSLRVSRCGGREQPSEGPLTPGTPHMACPHSCLYYSCSSQFPKFLPLFPASLASIQVRLILKNISVTGQLLSLNCPEKNVFLMSCSQLLATTKPAVPNLSKHRKAPHATPGGCFSSSLTYLVWNVF